MIRLTKPALAGLLCAAALGACKKSNEQYAGGNVDTTAAKAPDTTAAASATAVTPTNTKWSTPTIVGFAVAANNGEIALGKLAETKGTNGEVKQFGKMMVTDHSAMLAATKKLGTKLNAQPDTTAGDVTDLMNHGRDEMKDLTDKPKGADWDKDYIDKAVSDHQAVLGKLQDAAKTNTDPDVSKALTEATAKVQAHLTKAQAIQAKLNK
jgi:predicted outer membrane protein